MVSIVPDSKKYSYCHCLWYNISACWFVNEDRSQCFKGKWLYAVISVFCVVCFKGYLMCWGKSKGKMLDARAGFYLD